MRLSLQHENVEVHFHNNIWYKHGFFYRLGKNYNKSPPEFTQSAFPIPLQSKSGAVNAVSIFVSGSLSAHAELLRAYPTLAAFADVVTALGFLPRGNSLDKTGCPIIQS